MRWSAIILDGKLKLEGSSYEESGAEIYANDDGTFDLFEITLYGCATLFYNTYDNINTAIQVAENWT